MLRSPARPVLLAAAALLATAAPAAALTPTAPSGTTGVPVSPYAAPVFTWAAEAGETQTKVHVSKAATLDANGVLLSDVEAITPPADATPGSATATAPLFSGTYFWQPSALGPDNGLRAPAPVAFTIAPKLTARSGSASCVRSRRLVIKTAFRTNVEKLRLQIAIYRGTRRLANDTYTLASFKRSQITLPTIGTDSYKPLGSTTFAKGRYKVVTIITGKGVRSPKVMFATCR